MRGFSRGIALYSKGTKILKQHRCDLIKGGMVPAEARGWKRRKSNNGRRETKQETVEKRGKAVGEKGGERRRNEEQR